MTLTIMEKKAGTISKMENGTGQKVCRQEHSYLKQDKR